MSNNLIVGKRIRELREERKISQQKLGESLGHSHAAISDIERGKSKLGVEDLYKIADFFDISVSEILETPPSTTGRMVLNRGSFGQTSDEISDHKKAQRAFIDFVKNKK